MKKLHTTVMESRPFKGWERFDTYLVREEFKVLVVTSRQGKKLVTEATAVHTQPDEKETHRAGHDYREVIFSTESTANKTAVLTQHSWLILDKLERAVISLYSCKTTQPSAG